LILRAELSHMCVKPQMVEGKTHGLELRFNLLKKMLQYIIKKSAIQMVHAKKIVDLVMVQQLESLESWSLLLEAECLVWQCANSEGARKQQLAKACVAAAERVAGKDNVSNDIKGSCLLIIARSCGAVGDDGNAVKFLKQALGLVAWPSVWEVCDGLTYTLGAWRCL
jgi:hypothetical protein